MSNTCWMCGAPADSGEHRFKKTDMKTLFGANIKRNDTLWFNKEGKVFPLQSTDSKFIKSKILCKDCNGNRSQPYDRAYEKFIRFISDNKDSIVYKRFIDFSEIYGSDWGNQQVNLYKYFVKSFGNKLAYADMPIPKDLVDIFDQKTFKTALLITFSVNEAILKIHKDRGIKGGVGNGNLYVNQSYLDGIDEIRFFKYSQHYDWLDIHYYYNHSTDGTLGSTWIGNMQFVYLGSSDDNSLLDQIYTYNFSKVKWFVVPYFPYVYRWIF